jgi:ABC-type bacteriocin/lantibiotic exporter with double-glycine peptidase domain
VRSLSYATTFQSNRQVLREQLPNVVELRARLDRLAKVEADGHATISGFGDLRLEGVGYRYLDGRRALAGVDASISSGDFVLITGPSGAGKSTLLDVLIGLRVPTEGEVLVDGRPLHTVDRASWSRLVGFVPQEPSLLRGTVRDNITFFRDGFSDDEVSAAAEAASVLDDILRLPQGFDTELGPRGAGLSGGQKQRVAIARALLGRPSLLVLDEPNSALDRQAQLAVESTIVDLLGTVTVVLVTHREVLGQGTPDVTLTLEPPRASAADRPVDE